MKVSRFAVLIAEEEGKRIQVNIAQIKEILKVINCLVEGELYKMIRRM